MNLIKCGTTFLLFLTFLPLICLGADTTLPKAYNPFDEPRPRIPKEITEDKRLDMNVKVFVKSKNMKQLFADLSAKTGVRFTVSREIWGERPIIFFHNRSVRDVMTEISVTFGYYWLVGGKEGALTYELVEDVKHSKLRAQRLSEIKDRENALLMELMKKTLDGTVDTGFMERSMRSRIRTEYPQIPPDKIEQLIQSRADAFVKMGDELRKGATLFSSFGDDLLRRALADGKAMIEFKNLSHEMQRLLFDSFKTSYDSWNNGDHETSAPFLNTIEDLANTSVRIVRRDSGSGLLCRLSDPGRDVDGHPLTWPEFGYSAAELEDALHLETPPELRGDAGVPEKPTVTKKGAAWIGNFQGLRIGDALQAIAEQSKLDVIADYRFDEDGPWNPSLLGPLEKMPLNQVTRLVCTKWKYACKVEEGTIRFRRVAWFMNNPLKEPPADLLARCCKRIEHDGIVQFRDAAEMGRLPEEQRDWPGFKHIPGGQDNIMYSREAVMLWTLFGAPQLDAARTEEGFRLSDLSPAQWRTFVDWSAGLKEQLSVRSVDDLWNEGSIHVTDVPKSDWEEHGVFAPAVTSVFCVEIKRGPYGTIWRRNIETPKPIGEDVRKRFAAQRKADAEADVVEVLK